MVANQLHRLDLAPKKKPFILTEELLHIIIMNKKVTHCISYDGVDYEVFGEYHTPEEETGYKGGFSWMQIKINDMDVSQHLNQNTIDTLQDLVVELNY